MYWSYKKRFRGYGLALDADLPLFLALEEKYYNSCSYTVWFCVYKMKGFLKMKCDGRKEE